MKKYPNDLIGDIMKAFGKYADRPAFVIEDTAIRINCYFFMSYKSYINHLSNRILIIAYIRIHSANNTSITITKGSIAIGI